MASAIYPLQPASSDLWLAAKAGLVGATFSIALAIRNRTVALDTDLIDNVTDGTLRLLIGVISAWVLLLLFASGVVPSLKIGDADFKPTTLTWEMVLVNGFVGGFLERLVPDLLEKRTLRGTVTMQQPGLEHIAEVNSVRKYSAAQRSGSSANSSGLSSSSTATASVVAEDTTG